MEKFEVGDKVEALDDDFKGVVKSIENSEITIETSDGFTMTFNVNDLLKSKESSNLYGSISNHSIREAKLAKDSSSPKKSAPLFKSRGEIPPPEFDLHIEKLVKNHKGLSNFDRLNYQMDTAKRHVEFAIKNRIPKIILIHGVGEGILKADLDFLLGRYENLTYKDANYQKYGVGATEIIFKQS